MNFLKKYILTTSICLLVASCMKEPPPCASASPDSPLIGEFNNVHTGAFCYLNDSIRCYSEVGFMCSISGLPIDITKNSFKIYVHYKYGPLLDSITFSYKIGTLYTERCGHRYFPDDLKISESSIPGVAVEKRFCSKVPYYKIYFTQ
jgi:hypothetical protein